MIEHYYAYAVKRPGEDSYKFIIDPKDGRVPVVQNPDTAESALKQALSFLEANKLGRMKLVDLANLVDEGIISRERLRFLG